MKHTARQSTTRTLIDLYRAIDHRRAVTITYLDSKGALTVRTIEIHELHAKTGDYEIVAMCRLQNAERDFSLSGVQAYTVHRMAYVLDRPEPTKYERPAAAPSDDADALYYYELSRDPDDADYKPRALITALAA